MRRVLRKALIVIAVVLALPVVALAAAIAFANTEPGRLALARLVSAVTAGTSAAVAIEGLHGSFPDRLAAARITVSDPDGPWLVIEDAMIAWSPFALARRRAQIDAITAHRIAVMRPPRPTGPAAAGEGGALPVAVVLQRLAIDRLELPPGPAGAVALSVAGAGTLDGAAMQLRVVGEGLDGVAGRFETTVDLDAERIAATLSAASPGIDRLDAALGLAGQAPVAIEGRLAGPRAAAALDLRGSVGPLTLGADGQLDLVRLDGSLRFAAHSGALTPLPGIGWSDATLSGTLRGPFAAARVEASLAASQVAAAGAAIGRLELAADVAVAPDATELGLSGTLAGLGLPGVPPDLLGDTPVVLEARAAIANAGDALTLRSLAVHHPLLSLEGDGSLRGQDLAGRLALDLPALRPLLALLGQPGDGALALVATLGGTRAAPTLALTGDARVAGAPPPAGALLGPQAHLDAALAADVAARQLRIARLRIAGQGASIEASGSASTAAVDLGWRIEIPELAVLARGVAGALTAHGALRGPHDDLAATLRFESARLMRDRWTLAPLVAEGEVAGLPAAPRATLRVTGLMNDAPVVVAAHAVAPPGGPWVATLDEATLPGLSARGEAAGQGAALQRARLALEASDLAPLGGLLGRAMRGAAQVTLAAAQPAGAAAGALPEGTLDAALRDLALPGVASVARATLHAALGDVAATPQVTVRLEAGGIAAAGLEVATARVELAGPTTALRAQVAADGRDVEARLSGTIAADPADPIRPRVVELAPGRLRWRGETAQIQGTSRIVVDDGLAIAGLRIALRGGSIAAEGRVAASGNDLRVTVARLPLALAEMAMPGTPLAGTVDGELRLTGTLAAPTGRLRATVHGAKVTTGSAGLLPPVNATIAAELLGSSAQLDVAAQAGSATRLRAQGRVPLSAAGAVDLRVTGALDLALTDLVLAQQGRLMRGRATIDATARGPAAAPVLAGSVTLEGGRVEDAVNGIRVTDLAGTLALRGQTLAVGPLRGHIGGGDITVAGQVGVLDPGLPVDLRVTTRGGRVVDSPFATVAADADIVVRGSAAGTLTATGPIRVHRAEFRIAERLPPNLPTLQVREVGGTPQQRAAAARVAQARGAPAARAQSARARAPTAYGGAEQNAGPAADAPPAGPPAGGPQIVVDIPITMPSAVFVRGRGLEAEVGGNLRLGGTTAALGVTGALTLRRGNFEIAGQRLNFSRGTLSFDPGIGIDPLLDLEATTAAGGVTATIRVGGRASAPTITLTSDPNLPPDEILAHMLYGTATSGLSPLQILRVASAVAEFSGLGGGGDITDRVRRSLGLDVLSVEGGAGNGVGGEAGRYVREGVYVGVRSRRSTAAGAAGTQQTEGVVRVEVLPHVKIEAGAGTAGSIGITYERDY